MKKFTELLAESLGMPKDVMMDLPRVSICGDREIYIENHKGLLEYSDNMIRVKMNDGIIDISGTGLRIIIMEQDRMVVNGVLENINYEKIGRNLKNVQKNL